MACTKRINFVPGIRKISQLVNPLVNINARALNLIGKIIANLNETIITQCERKFKPSKRNNCMRVSVAENTVTQLFKGQMKVLAQAEGNKCLMKFHSGLLRYAPKKVSGAKSKEKKMKKGYESQFSKGTSTLAKAAFAETSLQIRGKQLICKMLGEIAKKISDEAKAEAQTCNSNRLEPIHIRTVVEHIMAEEMRKHADAEGAKMIFFLEAKRIIFEPPTKRAAKTALAKPPSKRRKLVCERRVPVSRPKVRKARSPKSVAAKKMRKTPERKKKLRKRTVSKTRARKRSVSRARARKRAVSRQKTVSRRKKVAKKTATTRRTVCRTGAPSRKRKPASQARKRKATPKKKSIRARKTKAVGEVEEPTPLQKCPELSPSAIQGGVKKLNATFHQSIERTAVQLIKSKLYEIVESITTEICNDSSANIGAREVQEAILKLFPTELQRYATARISQVTTNI